MADPTRPDGEATADRRSTASLDPELLDLYRNGGREWLAYQDSIAEADRIARHRQETLAALSGERAAPRTEVPPPGVPEPERPRAAVPTAMPTTRPRVGFAEEPQSRFREELGPGTPVSVVGATPRPARGSSPSAPGSLLDRATRGWQAANLGDRAKRAWQAVKPLVDRAAQFAKDNPGLTAGAVAGGVGGFLWLGPGGAVIGAGLGAAVGAVTQLLVRAYKNWRLAGQSVPRGEPQVTREAPSVSSPRQDTNRTRTQAVGPDRPRSRQFDGPARSDTHRTGLRASGEVAGFAALRAGGTERTASSSASRDSATRPVTPVAKTPGRRLTS
ncbi:hypothetical protein KQY30_15365 [Streptomyces sp. GMY02]|uniref:hypothetical protein n=1 Tax=Streptomyces sp. GMY02 TaxID=1333528 RepID=UPI001C2BE55C|nr:hypothetical protein [Streptomyces sp. GMY02]QXE35435.1 hypothetical protein KQY30_15365 [Streptomyces sp. GMY02]